MIAIDFIDETDVVTEKQCALIEALIATAAKEEGLDGSYELSVTFMTDEMIQVYNRDYRGIDRPTDVISFALEDEVEGEVDIIGDIPLPVALGDLLISIDTMKRQAVEYGHSETRELGFLAVHGFLHLLGYDHETKEEETIMFGKQNRVLEAHALHR
ncbi:rRNA maturation RNase YbeY [Planococcaceae bacterium Storch 2/2-2]|nr:rRNA maturation RNase YbeY [Planococcaceae bacterium Storch 2/2-2]